ncbi:response regulator [Herbaspirillum lusitanum]|jgi:twitching motility two-component system response regulator PilG|uniref:Response regulator n=1 Tax=Herbaspirillum lusitanum TaxID=213312 RepID=A0ABW9AG41_9BURK
MTNQDDAALHILVVDDSNTIRRSADLFLTQAGYQVTLAEDGFDALSKIAAQTPGLIFCDILMPRIDGYQLCALLKQNERYRDIPIVMLSSKDSLFDRARASLVGADEYLTKPFSKESLLQTVSAQINAGHPGKD